MPQPEGEVSQRSVWDTPEFPWLLRSTPRASITRLSSLSLAQSLLV
jgi:hypothetical protein